MNQHSFAHEAMATSFQITLAETDPAYARQAATAAFDELDLLETRFSRFVEGSDISRINRLAPGESTVVALDTFQCLEIARDLKQQTGGTFDIAYGSTPTFGCAEGIELAPGCVVRVLAEGLRLDLGGIGKGFALDRIADMFGEWEIEGGLLQASTSTMLAWGSPREEPGWPIQFGPEHDRRRILLGAPGRTPNAGGNAAGGVGPMREQHALAAGGTSQSPFPAANPFSPPVEVPRAAFSASGTANKGSHIIDPRTGCPADGFIRCWAGAPTAAVADALSTAFMVMTEDAIRGYCRRHPEVSAFLLRSHKARVLALGPSRTAVSAPEPAASSDSSRR